MTHNKLRTFEKFSNINLDVFGKKYKNNKADANRGKKQMAMFKLLRSNTPTFSGSIADFAVNYLFELDLIHRVTKEGTHLRVGFSPKVGDRYKVNTKK